MSRSEMDANQEMAKTAAYGRAFANGVKHERNRVQAEKDESAKGWLKIQLVLLVLSFGLGFFSALAVVYQ